MLLANELVADWLSERRSLAICRVQGVRDEEKLARLGAVAESLGVRVDQEALREPQGLARWHAAIAHHPRRSVLEMLLLRSLKQAAYDIVNAGHFGLASDAYLHFTSPIRRYPDLVVHRLVKHLLRGGKPATAPAEVETMRAAATAASERERAAIAVEREVVDLYRALSMQQRVGEVFDGTISALVGSGAFVTLDQPFVDVLVRFDSMGPDHYEFAQDEISVVGLRSGDRITLGDRVRVRVDDVSVLRRAVYGARLPHEPKRRGKGRNRGGQRRPQQGLHDRGESVRPRTGRRRRSVP
jgi:ribonuclease R